MANWVKVILVLFAILIVVAAAVSFVTVRRLSAGKARLVEERAEFRREGREFGRGKAPVACIDESISRLRSAAGFPGEVKAKLFLEGCLSSASSEAAFCESIPRSHEAAAGEWTMNECRRRDAAEIPRCSRVLQEVVRYCDSPASK